MLVAENVIEEDVLVEPKQETENTFKEEDQNPKEEQIQIKPIAVVISSRGSQAENADAIRHLQLMALFPVHVYFYQNNGISLTSVYNQILEQVQEDRVVFIHDDAEPITAGWARTLYRIFENNPEYGIVGVAGSKDFDSDGAWWIYKNKYGSVFHRKDVKDQQGNTGYLTFKTVYSEDFDHDLEEVAVVDGLFIAIDKTRIKHKFDVEMTGFNFYDINFCLDHFIDKSTKIGVTTKIRLSHKGVGVIRPEWFVNRAKTMDKFAQYLPISNLQLNTPVEGKAEVDAFKEENDPWKKGEIKLVTPEEAEALKKQQESESQNTEA